MSYSPPFPRHEKRKKHEPKSDLFKLVPGFIRLHAWTGVFRYRYVDTHFTIEILRPRPCTEICNAYSLQC